MSLIDSHSSAGPTPVAKTGDPNEAGVCANCDETLHGLFCAKCGQRTQDLRQPIGRYLKEAFVELFGVDGRLWQSLIFLLFQPGQITKAYVAGHRVRYIRPLRLYLIASLLMFFVISVLDPVSAALRSEQDALADSMVTVSDYRATLQDQLDASAQLLRDQEALVDSLDTQFVKDSLALAANNSSGAATIADQEAVLEDLLDERNKERKNLEWQRQRAEKEKRRLSWEDEQLATARPDSLISPAIIERASALLFEEAASDRVTINLPEWWPQSDAIRQMRSARTNEELTSSFVKFFQDGLRRLPTVMFVLLPIFALLLKLLYLRNTWYFSEHLVFGLHTHAFAFMLFTVIMLLTWVSDGAGWANVIAVLLSLFIPIYFYIAQKRVYQQSWLKTALKAWILGWMYFFVLTAGVLLALMLAAAF